MLKLVGMIFMLVLMRKMWVEIFSFMILLGMLLMNSGSGFNYGGSSLCLDWLSSGLVLLSIWVVMLSGLGSVNFNSNKWFLLCLSTLLGVLVLTFSSQSVLLFYISFETSLIPLFILMSGWGVQPERLQAGIYFVLYTLVGSLPLLLSFIYIYSETGSVLWGLESELSIYIWLGLLLAFLMKLPLFLVHLWLPKAHVEAPLAGSMILAGVTLKLGVYGIIRLYSISFAGNSLWGFLILVVGGVGSMVLGLVCLRQVDLKALIAYSSVSHMGVGLAGVLVMNQWGVTGGYWLLVAHGLASSGMFGLAGMIYSRSGSRSVYLNKGLMNFMPSMCMWWFLLCICNMASPPSLNLISEIFILIGVGSWSMILLLSMLMGGFLSACYSLYVYSFSQHGSNKSGGGMSSGYCGEYLFLSLHWLPLNILFLGLYLLV